MEDGNEQQVVLDGKYGAGVNAVLTIVTAGPLGDKEETFLVPYAVVDKKTLNQMVDINMIRGFKIVKQEPAKVGS